MTEKLLLDTLDDFARRNAITDLWLRDDDATQPSAALDQLLDLSERYSIPMTLAVIPEPTGGALAKRLEHTSHIDVAVHGWAHQNHAGPEEKKRELGLHRPLETVLGELQAGLEKLNSLHEPRFVQLLVPPWNRIDETIIEHLSAAGYQALSVYGPEKPGRIPLLNTHVDVIDWRGTRGGKDHDLLFAETAARMRDAHDTGGMTGILTHHLDHDESVWSFLQRLFTLTADHPGCRWRSSRQWLEALSP
ncbi:polysaccharide deacetylase family protein [Agrobacterium rosae]|uniref:Chitooligosaccharide deacetylase n=1 Tax=Agrobacterium rosae TaxID=1972867 RepID=A0AAE5RUM4_9HYPH|nr:polysaccharide deacetylase family protein [Agrobacterium rosae]KAA3510387.1 polysaccharide deacetylase [Agrobacterium rosae]KAA3517107.1 polysaccharide deacetylase [Agrobacterium rosae]MCM2434537.1 polysaccharide deacetylase family protein [Agrobacterium rosae]MDX8330077.1 polysaccharide deacetylase family protein [Agrobacterium rosae]MQB49818.1 polysaccharide deacetylase [Agrobacterium rosae]